MAKKSATIYKLVKIILDDEHKKRKYSDEGRRGLRNSSYFFWGIDFATWKLRM